jgi:hypothetical protein
MKCPNRTETVRKVRVVRLLAETPAAAAFGYGMVPVEPAIRE